MLALAPRVIEVIWSAVEPLLPPRPPDRHPLGCHRPRVADRDCFLGILYRLVTGCSWDVAGRLAGVGETTLRRRRDEWLIAGVFDRLAEEALEAYDRIVGLDLSEVALDASQHKAPCGGPGTGPNCTDKGRSGWKWSLATDAAGIPISWIDAPANRHDAKLVDITLDAVEFRGLHHDIETIHMDRGYDFAFVRDDCVRHGLTDHQIARTRKRPAKGRLAKKPIPLGLRWPIERTNSWLTNFGQLRRNTDRQPYQRRAQLSFAIAIVLTIKLIKWADRWNA